LYEEYLISHLHQCPSY